MSAETTEFVQRALVNRGVWAPELKGKVAIVTGAGRLRSIGRPIALELARQGVQVVLTGTGRDPSTYPPDEQEIGWRDIESVAEECRSAGAKALPLVSDISDPAAVEKMVQRTLDEYGRIDILVNNAGAARGSDRVPVVELGDSEWLKVINTNLNGTFFASRSVARHLIRQGEGGNIINISSIASKLAGANSAAYSASKAGINAFGHALAMELAPHNIRVNTICPGIIETARMDDLGRGERWQQTLQRIPLGFAGNGMECAYATTFLCSDLGAFITGQTLNVDGGTTWH